MKKRIFFYTFVAALGGLLFGYDTAVINGALPFFTDYFQLTNSMQGWAVSSALIGCIVGAFFIGRLGDKYGRRSMLRVMALFFLISAIGSGLADSLTIFVVYRFLGGMAIGGASVLSPMYITEIAPPKYRGRLTITFQLSIVLGILVAFYADYLLLDIGENNWRWMFASEAIPAFLFFGLLFFVGRSPRWLIAKGKLAEAREVIISVNNVADVESTFTEIKESINTDEVESGKILLQKPYFKLVIIGILIGMFNQFTGINIVMYYATDIFRTAGFSTESAIGQTVLIGITNLVFTLIAMQLIDKIGRKILLLIGSIGMALFLGIFSFFFLTGTMNFVLVICLIGFVAFFAASQGAVIWVLFSEMFPNNIRSRGVAIGTFSHWFFNGLTSFLFPIVAGAFTNGMGTGYIFAFYALATLTSYFFYKKYLIETKGKSLEQIEKELFKNETK
ncbi:sugar porter family MFS transporter [Aureibaculum algae]|uniref:Sugar porter family MFS transporter n=1 Tax=Aureibaculum algae TaxID=2584122 RepID=A0A5B7TYG6_9FLAO|nr:sugar porter family MFS transporter [Aureibaculum algae]QCX40404.1 sugar porter family MFS transporter [Aureibaculum algae]